MEKVCIDSHRRSQSLDNFFVPLRFILLHEAEYKKLVVILVTRCSTLGQPEYLRRKHKCPTGSCLMRDVCRRMLTYD